mmetsp:Transcript_31582/g.65986  ORF Transcript_31582/g.65986 Transcript_31582/m.65986 type:complete len:205 (+) Transcript_31582:52-666(+)
MRIWLLVMIYSAAILPEYLFFTLFCSIETTHSVVLLLLFPPFILFPRLFPPPLLRLLFNRCSPLLIFCPSSKLSVAHFVPSATTLLPSFFELIWHILRSSNESLPFLTQCYSSWRCPPWFRDMFRLRSCHFRSPLSPSIAIKHRQISGKLQIFIRHLRRSTSNAEKHVCPGTTTRMHPNIIWSRELETNCFVVAAISSHKDFVS